MASSGYFENKFRTGYTLRMEWKVNSQSIEDNTSNVTVTVFLVSGGSSYTINSSASKTVQLEIDGVSYEKKAAGLVSLSGNQKKSLFSKTVTVKHNSDGTKKLELFCWLFLEVTLSGVWYGNRDIGPETVTLDTIPRATTPTVTGTLNVGSEVTINTPRASSAFTHTLQYSLNNSSWTNIATGVGTSTTWKVPDALATATPKATSGMVYIRCITYSGNTNLGNKTITRGFYITSSYAKPGVVASYSQSNSAGIDQYIRGVSIIKFSATAYPKVGASIAKYVFEYNGVEKTVNTTATTANVTFTLPNNADPLTYGVTVIDSRGYSAFAGTAIITTVAYTSPVLTSVAIVRGNYNGTTFTENSKGNNLRIVAKGSITSLSNANAKNYKVEYRLSNSTSYTTLINTKAASAYAVSVTEYTDAIFSENASYVLRFTLSDSFNTVSQIVDVPSQKVLLNFSANGKAMAIGGIASVDDALEVMMELYATGGIKPMQIANGSDFNEIVKPGMYIGNASSGGYVNPPMTTGTFVLEVSKAGSAGQVMQRYAYVHKSQYRAYVRFLYESTWGAWQPSEGFTSFSIGAHAGQVRFANGFVIQWGRVSITPTAANTITEKVIKFPISHASSPICHVSANSAAPNILTCSYTADADELTLCMTRTNTTATYISWTSFGISA